METCFQTIRIVAGRGEQEGEREEKPPPFLLFCYKSPLEYLPPYTVSKRKTSCCNKNQQYVTKESSLSHFKPGTLVR